jgi:hypothetical protein
LKVVRKGCVLHGKLLRGNGDHEMEVLADKLLRVQ